MPIWRVLALSLPLQLQDRRVVAWGSGGGSWYTAIGGFRLRSVTELRRQRRSPSGPDPARALAPCPCPMSMSMFRFRVSARVAPRVYGRGTRAHPRPGHKKSLREMHVIPPPFELTRHYSVARITEIHALRTKETGVALGVGVDPTCSPRTREKSPRALQKSQRVTSDATTGARGGYLRSGSAAWSSARDQRATAGWASTLLMERGAGSRGRSLCSTR